MHSWVTLHLNRDIGTKLIKMVIGNKIKNKMINRVIILMLLVLVANCVEAQVITELEISQDIHIPGDIVIVKVKLSNSIAEQVDLILESSLANQGGTYPLAIIPNFITLNANEEKIVTLYNFEVKPESDEDLYFVSIRVLSGNSVISTNDLTFQIEDTLKEMQIDFKTCKDQSCNLDSNIFYKNENIYLDYTASVSDISIDATLTYPDDSEEDIILPTSITANQIGTYNLEVIASKDGYKTIYEKIQFGVIEGEANIKEAEDTYEKNPEPYYKIFFERYGYLIYILIELVIFFVLIFLIVRLFLRKKKEKELQITRLSKQ